MNKNEGNQKKTHGGKGIINNVQYGKTQMEILCQGAQIQMKRI
jgi:hypothetical protein